MKLLSDINYSIDFDCPYIKGEKARFRMFHAQDLSAEELETLLSAGYRKFGTFFFKPHCMKCQQCVPIRTLTHRITATKSQRRALKKASAIEIEFKELKYRDEIYEIYEDHSRRFQEKKSSLDDFLATFYTVSCPALQSEYYLDGKLFAVGFIDLTEKGFSSVYFIYKEEYAFLSPGTISVFLECEEARKRGLPYYYLGYYIESNSSMNYKIRYKPYELFNWKSRKWNSKDSPHYTSHIL